MQSKNRLRQLKALLRLIPVLAIRPRQVRFLREWHETFWSNALNDRKPWINFAAREWLDQTLHREMRVFEYGSGGSTLYFASRVRELVSVEHDQEWSRVVQTKLHNESCEHVDSMFFPPEPDGAGPTEDGAGYRSVRFHHDSVSFRQYVRSIDRFPDESFDVVFVDGRARNDCARHALPKVKTGGYLVLDNSHRKDYSPVHQLLNGYELQEFRGICAYGKSRPKTTAWKITHSRGVEANAA